MATLHFKKVVAKNFLAVHLSAAYEQKDLAGTSART